MLLFSSFTASSAVMSSIVCDTCPLLKPSPRVIGPIGLSFPQNDRASRNTSSHDYYAELPSELLELIELAENPETDYITRTSNLSEKYFASFTDGSYCSSKSASSFESWEESFSSLEECCEMAFSWDLDACLER
eukprot:CCRYP_004298-RA/>CCRYP_004298-RA protein AED:0.45 eAED:0.45 QI:0/-1/0/1/-1/0/1/0/133